MSRITVLALGLLAVCAPRAFGQIIYEPVQYQYGTARAYYYAGNNPLIHRAAQAPSDSSGRWGRVGEFATVSATIDTHREVVTEHVRTFNDSLGYQDASIYGYTANDARNDANAKQARYFRKSDLIASAIPQSDGSLLVPAQPSVQGPRIYVPVVQPPEPATAPRPIMIIPKSLLEQKPSDNRVTAAN
jgi:hypothetical protein